jgi:glutathione S-transferase
MITLFHHPFSRAAGILWTLEEVGQPYELQFVDMMAGKHKSPEMLALNPMGKLPVLKDGDVVVTEGAAISLYLGDRYSSGKLAPAPDDPRRGTYLRWSLFAPSVVEPGALAKLSGWQFKPSQAGWGDYDTMVNTIETAIAGKDFILGNSFSIADCIFGGGLRYMLRFKMIEERPVFTAYVERCTQRPASQRADAKNAAVVAEHNLGR